MIGEMNLIHTAIYPIYTPYTPYIHPIYTLYPISRIPQGPGSGEEFSVSSKSEVDPGFLEVYGTRDRDEAVIPTLTKGQSYRICTMKLRQGLTSAPGFLTESELIGMMEQHGIGTDASIATVRLEGMTGGFKHPLNTI